MSAQIIDGKKISEDIRKHIKNDVQMLIKKGIKPGLATVLVGDDPGSQIYVRNKIKACEEAGIYSDHHKLSADTEERKLLELITILNRRKEIHGILVQLPLPRHINAHHMISAIDPLKDVDCFHPESLGIFLSIKTWAEMEKERIFLPCTPHGVIELLIRTGIELEGSHAVIVGRSNIVGKPLALMLMAHNATVTICHSRTRNLSAVTSQADILVAAIGKAKFVTGDMVKKGAVVIDVGMNRSSEGLCGDVDFDQVKQKAAYITPVPGGVGPMTITMLLSNTLLAAQKYMQQSLSFST